MTQLLRILESKPQDTYEELSKVERDVRLYQFTVEREIERLDLVREANIIAIDEYLSSAEELRRVES